MYDGPIIDAHTHAWNLAEGDYPWLMPDGQFGPAGRLDRLKGTNYLLEDYRRDTQNADIVATVHVEALWNSADDPVNETRWLEGLSKDHGEAVRYVAGATFGHPDTIRQIREQAAFERVKAIRQTIAWTPNPDHRMASEANITRRPAWREALPELVRNNLGLELLIYPWQADNVVELAADFPDLQIIIDHIGSPIDQSADGLARWYNGISDMARQPNVVVKMSSAASYPEGKSKVAVEPFINHLLETFGPSRLIYGSDFPVEKLLGWSFLEYLRMYQDVLSELSTSEQRAIFLANAARVYDIEVSF